MIKDQGASTLIKERNFIDKAIFQGLGLGESQVAHKRKVYLINPKFQIKFSILICFLMLLATCVYPVLIYDLMGHFAIVAQKNSFDTHDLEKQKTALVYTLIFWQLGFTALVFIISIFFSHKIAGPLYKLKQFLGNIRQGQNIGKLTFRQGDYFQDLAEEYNQAFSKIQENHRKDFVYLNEVSAYLNNLALIVPEDKKAVISEINQRLSEIQNRYNS